MGVAEKDGQKAAWEWRAGESDTFAPGPAATSWGLEGAGLRIRG